MKKLQYNTSLTTPLLIPGFITFILLMVWSLTSLSSQDDIQKTIDESPSYILNKLPDGFEYYFEPIIFQGDIKYKVSIRIIPVYKKWGKELLGGGSLLGLIGVFMIIIKFWSTIKELIIRRKQ